MVFLQFFIVPLEDTELARQAVPDVPHLGRMYEQFDPDEGSLPLGVRLPGVRRPRSEPSDEEQRSKVCRFDGQDVIELPGDRKRQISTGSEGSGNPRPHVAPCLPHVPDESSEDAR
eukprot:6270174-Pyramimonas_sp.AAC.1